LPLLPAIPGKTKRADNVKIAAGKRLPLSILTLSLAAVRFVQQ